MGFGAIKEASIWIDQFAVVLFAILKLTFARYPHYYAEFIEAPLLKSKFISIKEASAFTLSLILHIANQEKIPFWLNAEKIKQCFFYQPKVVKKILLWNAFPLP